MSDEKTAGELDGSGYTRSGDGPAEWANAPGVAWTVTATWNGHGFARLEDPVTTAFEGLELAADAVTVRLS